MGGGGILKAVVATDWILSGAVVVGVLRDCSAEGREGRGGRGGEGRRGKGKEGNSIYIYKYSVTRVNVHGIAQLFRFPVPQYMHVPSLFGDPSGDSDFDVAADKALAKCESTSS